MKTLNFICPYCIFDRQEKIDITGYYSDELTIKWECPNCTYKGEFIRIIKKPNIISRMIKAIFGEKHE